MKKAKRLYKYSYAKKKWVLQKNTSCKINGKTYYFDKNGKVTTQAPTTEKPTEAATKHTHNWLVSDQTYGERRICNICGADITGISAKQHIADTAVKTNIGTKDDPVWADVSKCNGSTHTETYVTSTTWICSGCDKVVKTNGEDMPKIKFRKSRVKHHVVF
jgi:hypothetical protein